MDTNFERVLQRERPRSLLGELIQKERATAERIAQLVQENPEEFAKGTDFTAVLRDTLGLVADHEVTNALARGASERILEYGVRGANPDDPASRRLAVTHIAIPTQTTAS